jgi:hypothetical protein
MRARALRAPVFLGALTSKTGKRFLFMLSKHISAIFEWAKPWGQKYVSVRTTSPNFLRFRLFSLFFYLFFLLFSS